MKRLLRYSTINHVGFLLLALRITSEESTSRFIFYLTQYSLTNLNTFLILLAFAYRIGYSTNVTTYQGKLLNKLSNASSTSLPKNDPSTRLKNRRVLGQDKEGIFNTSSSSLMTKEGETTPFNGTPPLNETTLLNGTTSLNVTPPFNGISSFTQTLDLPITNDSLTSITNTKGSSTVTLLGENEELYTLKIDVLCDKEESKDVNYIKELVGQFNENPILRASFGLCLFSLRGIPPLLGFFGKYRVLSSLIHEGYYFLAIVRILTSVISAAYYLRILSIIYFTNQQDLVLSNKTTLLSSFLKVSNKNIPIYPSKTPTLDKGDRDFNSVFCQIDPEIKTFLIRPYYQKTYLMINSLHSFIISVFTLLMILF